MVGAEHDYQKQQGNIAMSKTIAIVCIALEALGDRDPDGISAEELLMAVAKAFPGTSAAELRVAAEFLKQLASRLKGAAWRIDPENRLAREPIHPH